MIPQKVMSIGRESHVVRRLSRLCIDSPESPVLASPMISWFFPALYGDGSSKEQGLASCR